MQTITGNETASAIRAKFSPKIADGNARAAEEAHGAAREMIGEPARA